MKTFKLFFLLLTTGLFFCNCQTSNKIHFGHTKPGIALAQNAIFQYLQDTLIYPPLPLSGVVKIDPVLLVRDTLKMADTLWLEDIMRSHELQYPLPPNRPLQLTIPDSLRHKFTYASPGQNYNLDQSAVFQFSTFLPSLVKDVFFIQYYYYFTNCYLGWCCRIISRGYLSCTIRNNKVISVKEAYSTDTELDMTMTTCFEEDKRDE